jgi:hypothetical protein
MTRIKSQARRDLIPAARRGKVPAGLFNYPQ